NMAQKKASFDKFYYKIVYYCIYKTKPDFMRNVFPILIAVALVSLFPSCQKEVAVETVVETDTVTVNLQRGLIAYYPFTGNANDSSGNNKHGMLINGTSFSTDVKNRANSAASFDGIDDYISITDGTNYFATTKLSISFLMNLNNSLTRSMIFSKGGFTTPTGVVWNSGITPTGNLNMTVGNPTDACTTSWVDNPSDALNSTSLIPANTWVHATLIYNMGVQMIYINGALSSAKIDDYNYLKQCASANLKIGGWWQVDPVSIHGKIDEVRIYNRILAENEIEKLAEERL
ncbi:MAG: LamG domain-containing protein, partial [Pedobacter sp.]